MNFETNPQAQSDLLLQTITGNIRQRLVDDAMAHIRPTIVARVDEILREMKPQVEAYRDVVSRGCVIKFSVREPRA